MDKWQYIKLIADEDRLLELLDRYNLPNTQSVTTEQARDFWQSIGGAKTTKKER